MRNCGGTGQIAHLAHACRTTRLSANQMIRVRKLLSYIVDKVGMRDPEQSSQTDNADGDSSINRGSAENPKLSKEGSGQCNGGREPWIWLELCMNGQVRDWSLSPSD